MFRFIVFFAVFISLPLYAGKLYKIVDQNGKVTFSQFPPQEKKEGDRVESVSAKGSAKTPITTKGAYQYCGDISLPSSQKYSSRSRYSSSTNYIERKLSDWKEQLLRVEKSIESSTQNNLRSNKEVFSKNKYQRRYANSYNNQEYTNTNVKRAKDLRCAIHWAESKNTQEERTKNSSELVRLQGVHDKLTYKLQEECGKQPQIDPSNPSYKSKKYHWNKCSKPIMNDIREVENAIRKARR